VDALVFLELEATNKGPVTLVAGVRSVVGVTTSMVNQTAASDKRLATNVAHERPATGVALPVLFETRRVAEDFVRGLTGVNASVGSQVPRIGEGFLTDLAAVRLHVAVNLLVTCKNFTSTIASMTNLALEQLRSGRVGFEKAGLRGHLVTWVTVMSETGNVDLLTSFHLPRCYGNRLRRQLS